MYSKIRLFAISLLFCSRIAHAELLILKQTEAGFTPLDDSDKKNNPVIEKILLQYQWPASAAYALDPITERRKVLAETGDLFTPDKPNAEELWIEKKIQHATGNNTYRVIFFPTALYELYLILDLLIPNETSEPTIPMDIKKEMSDPKSHTLRLNPIIESKKEAEEIRQDIKTIYQNMNQRIVKPGHDLHYYMNDAIVNLLLESYPNLRSCKNSLECCDLIKDKAMEILSSFVNQLLADENYDPRLAREFFLGIGSEFESQIISHYIDIEYEARKLNKAIVVRGTSFIKFEPAIVGNKSENKILAGTTVLNSQEASFEKEYKQNTLKPYSISFGNSLFAGIFNDPTACAYLFLRKNTGYALLINKKDYIDNRSSDLFFIAPLFTAISFFTAGEYFHSRTKAAVLKKDSQTFQIVGVHGAKLNDPTGVVLITRDPLKHASLFSQFLANNGRIIQFGDESTMTEEEKIFAQQVIKTQQEAANYYKGVKGATTFTSKMLPRARKRIKEKRPQEAALKSEGSGIK